MLTKGSEKARKSKLKLRYGLTEIQYVMLWTRQGGHCAICKRPETSGGYKTGATRSLAIDHCHTTNKIRGLLCVRCNLGLGNARDSVDLLLNCASYLSSTK